MQLPALPSLLSLAILAPLGLSKPVFQATPKPPSLEYLFTATVNIGKPLSKAPILTVTGGGEVVEPITSGTLTGPAINATIFGGTAYPTFYNNQTVEVPTLFIYGNTTDGYPFLAKGEGVGVATGQIVRISIDVAGPYAYLERSFILAELLPNEEKTVVKVEGWKASIASGM